MNNLDVEHFLSVYTDRLKMQEGGITHPTDDVKELTREIVKKLSEMPNNEPILVKNESLIDSKGNIIASLPTPTT
jgi:hypothetical protein